MTEQAVTSADGRDHGLERRVCAAQPAMRRPVVIPYPDGEEFAQFLERHHQSQITSGIFQFA